MNSELRVASSKDVLYSMLGVMIDGGWEMFNSQNTIFNTSKKLDTLYSLFIIPNSNL